MGNRKVRELINWGLDCKAQHGNVSLEGMLEVNCKLFYLRCTDEVKAWYWLPTGKPDEGVIRESKKKPQRHKLQTGVLLTDYTTTSSARKAQPR